MVLGKWNIHLQNNLNPYYILSITMKFKHIQHLHIEDTYDTVKLRKKQRKSSWTLTLTKVFVLEIIPRAWAIKLKSWSGNRLHLSVYKEKGKNYHN